MIDRSTNIRAALKSRQKGFLLNPFRFGGGGGTISDPHWANVVLLLRFNGGDGSTTITDSKSARAFTVFGNAHVETTQYKFGGSSLQLDGNGDYITGSGDLSPFAFGTGDYTIDFWAHKAANGTAGYDCAINTYTGPSSATGYNLEVASSRGFFFSGMGGNIISYVTNPNDSVWHHWAVCRASSTTRLFKDGIVVATVADTRNYLAAVLKIGNNYYNEYFNGYLEDFRITRAARWTANFAVPTNEAPTS